MNIPIFHIFSQSILSNYSMRSFTRYRTSCNRSECGESSCRCSLHVVSIIGSDCCGKFLFLFLFVFMNFQKQWVYFCLIVCFCMCVKEICCSKSLPCTLASFSPILNDLDSSFFYNLNQICSFLFIKLKLHRCNSFINFCWIWRQKLFYWSFVKELSYW